MPTEQRSKVAPALLALLVALLSLLLIFFQPLYRSEPQTVWMEDNTEAWTWDGAENHTRNISFAFNVSIPGNPKHFDLLASLLTAEAFNYSGEQSDNNRNTSARIALFFNGVMVTQGESVNGGGSTWANHCGIPCELSDIRYHRALHEGSNEVRFNVSYAYTTESKVPLSVNPKFGPIRVTLLEVDRDGDGVSDRYQLVQGVPTLIVALAAAVPTSATAYSIGRRVIWPRKP